MGVGSAGRDTVNRFWSTATGGAHGSDVSGFQPGEREVREAINSADPPVGGQQMKVLLILPQYTPLFFPNDIPCLSRSEAGSRCHRGVFFPYPV